MPILHYEDDDYTVDEDGFLNDPGCWKESFARGLAHEVGIDGCLTREHWDVIHFIRCAYLETGRCPMVYQTCRNAGLHLEGLRHLFPAGYQRGACRLAGLNFRHGFAGFEWQNLHLNEVSASILDRIYRVDSCGFLADPFEWDEVFALTKAFELKVPGGLTPPRWKVLRWLREAYRTGGAVPTLYETCEANDLDLAELEQLFPDGYHRGAVKLAGLRVR